MRRGNTVSILCRVCNGSWWDIFRLQIPIGLPTTQPAGGAASLPSISTATVPFGPTTPISASGLDTASSERVLLWITGIHVRFIQAFHLLIKYYYLHWLFFSSEIHCGRIFWDHSQNQWRSSDWRLCPKSISPALGEPGGPGIRTYSGRTQVGRPHLLNATLRVTLDLDLFQLWRGVASSALQGDLRQHLCGSRRQSTGLPGSCRHTNQRGYGLESVPQSQGWQFNKLGPKLGQILGWGKLCKPTVQYGPLSSLF